jgi:hypothetical protein
MRIAVVATLGLALLFASSAGAGQRGGTSLEFSPSTAPAWDWAHGSGCGYAVGTQVSLAIRKPEALAFQTAMPNAQGCISFAFTTDGPGMYLVDASQKSRNRWRLLASRELPVQ